MVEYLQFITQIKTALKEQPEWAKLIRYELNNLEEITDAEYHETDAGKPDQISTETCSSTEEANISVPGLSSGTHTEVSLESGSGNVPDGPTS